MISCRCITRNEFSRLGCSRKEKQVAYEIKRPSDEIDNLLNRCNEQIEKGESKYPGMSYEQGIREAIEWITGWGDDPPL